MSHCANSSSLLGTRWVELGLALFTALIGAPLFALIAWRAAREWRL